MQLSQLTGRTFVEPFLVSGVNALSSMPPSEDCISTGECLRLFDVFDSEPLLALAAPRLRVISYKSWVASTADHSTLPRFLVVSPGELASSSCIQPNNSSTDRATGRQVVSRCFTKEMASEDFQAFVDVLRDHGTYPDVLLDWHGMQFRPDCTVSSCKAGASYGLRGK